MKRHHGFLFAGLLIQVLGAAQQPAFAQGSAAPGAQPAALTQQQALKRSDAAKEMVLAATRAGRRLVSVGDYGVVLLSDDDGKSFRQARSVPTRATLTSVSFVDEKNGWAVGHWGVILRTVDAGETWTLLRSDTSVDRPLFSVYFFDAEHGVAVGLWSLVLTTSDGGKNWGEVKLPTPPEGGKADRNLFALFANEKGSLFAAAERGTILRSDDRGVTWTYHATGYKGSFWSGCALRDGTLLVGGLRGTIYRSADDGKTWSAIASGTQSSITGIAESGDSVRVVALDGVELQSADRGLTFKGEQREDRLSLTAINVTAGGKAMTYSVRGVVFDQSEKSNTTAK